MTPLERWIENNPEAAQWIKEGAKYTDLKLWGYPVKSPGTLVALRARLGLGKYPKRSVNVLFRRYAKAVELIARETPLKDVSRLTGQSYCTCWTIRCIMRREAQRQEIKDNNQRFVRWKR